MTEINLFSAPGTKPLEENAINVCKASEQLRSKFLSQRGMSQREHCFRVHKKVFEREVAVFRDEEGLCLFVLFPEEGKYHYDGHRACGIHMKPEESKKHNNMCPKCGRLLTIGVLNRVAELADRKEGFRPKNAIPFKSLIPLEEIIADAFSVGVASKRVRKEYEKVIAALGTEFDILLDADETALKSATLPEIAEGIIRVREGKVHIEPGYDGEYGEIEIFKESERKQAKLL